MNWTTLYIIGKEGFEKEVQRQLERSDIYFMNGAAGEAPGTCLYWIDKTVPLREVKKAIGADVIWKYRLQFSHSLEKDERVETPFTDREKKLIRDMVGRERKRNKLTTERSRAIL